MLCCIALHPQGSAIPVSFGLFLQLMTVAGAKLQAVNFSQFRNLFQGFPRERCSCFKCMQNNAFQQITEGQVLQLGESLQYLQKAFLDSYSGLYSLDFEHGSACSDKL